MDKLTQVEKGLGGEMAKGKPYVIVSIIDYVTNAVVSKTILRKTTGNVTLMSFDIGEEIAEKTSPFDNFIQVIDGTAEIEIRKEKFKLNLGEGIIIPAHAAHCFNADVRFKMISTIIKSGYESQLIP